MEQEWQKNFDYSPLLRKRQWQATTVLLPRKSHGRRSDFTFTFHFHSLEKEMGTHSSVLAWRIPGTGEPGGLLSMGLHRVGHDWSDLAAVAAATYVYIVKRGEKKRLAETLVFGGSGLSNMLWHWQSFLFWWRFGTFTPLQEWWIVSRCPWLVYCALDSFPPTLDNCELRSFLWSDGILHWDF